MISMQVIQEVADRIVRDFHPDRVILFGSYAAGLPDDDSASLEVCSRMREELLPLLEAAH